MNLLLVTNLFPTPFDPERGIFTLQLVKRMKEHCNVTVVCPLPWFPNLSFIPKGKYEQYASVPSQYLIDGVNVFCPKYPMIPKLSEKYQASLMAFGIKSCITNLHKELHFDAVNSQWLYPDSVAVDDVIQGLSIPHTSTGLGCDVNHDIYDPAKGAKILKMLHRSNAITVVSNSLRDELIKNNISANKITAIPNGIDVDQFSVLDKQDCRNKLGINIIKDPLLLYVGRLSEEKNVSSLLKATAKLLEKNKKIQLFLVGDGPLNSELTQLTNELNIVNNVHFVGKVDHSEVSTWMGACDYFSLPSLREGCPNVILEALGSGRPVIASRVGAIPDIVTEDSALLFTPQNIDEIANSLETALDKNWDENLIADSVKYLSWEHAAEKYCNVFKSTLGTVTY